MAEGRETKPVSFRIDVETQAKIQKIAQELGMNQQGTLQKLVEAFDLQRERQSITDPGKKELIDSFNFYSTKMIAAFTGVVQALQEADEKAEAKVVSKLESKDMTIVSLQEQKAAAEQAKTEAEERLKAVEEELKKLKEELSSLHEEHDQAIADYEEKLEEKNKTIYQSEKMQQLLQQEVDRLEEGASVVNAQKDEVAKLKADLEAKEGLLKAAQKEHELAELQHKREIMDLEKRYQEEKQATIDEYQEKYKNLLEKLEKIQSKEPTSPR